MENKSRTEEDNKTESSISKDDAEYRNLLIDIEQRVSEQFDKTMLTITGGSLAISLAFIKDVIGDGTMQVGWLLVTSWACLTTCLILILVSFYFGLLAYRKAQDQVDDKTIKQETPGGGYSTILSMCNAFGIALLCAGLITLFTFAYFNLTKEIPNGSKTNPSTSATTNPTAKAQTNSTTKTAEPAGQISTSSKTTRLPCPSTKATKVVSE